MRVNRQFARLLAAAIVTIVAYLAPSAVQAHAGHDHAALAVAAQVEALHAPDVVMAQPPAALVTSAVLAGREAAAFRVGVADADAAAPPKLCTGSCCCGTGMAACCTHALSADAGGHAVLGAVHVMAVPDDPALTGVAPEALPRPPRPCA